MSDSISKNFEERLNENCMTFKNLENLDQNMANLLDIKSVLVYKNCDDIKLNLDSKINRIIIKNCSNMRINLVNLISGLEIINSSNISVHIKPDCRINTLVMERSKNLDFVISKKALSETRIETIKSYSINYKDHNKKLIKK